MTKEGIEFIKSFEKLRLEAYKCQAGVWTIGYGHTQGVYEGKKITEEEAERLLASDIAKFEIGVRNLTVGLGLSDIQIDALVSLAFNIGLSAFKGSTLLKKIKANPNDREEISEEWKKWRLVNGRVSNGLVRRRAEEIDMYFSGWQDKKEPAVVVADSLKPLKPLNQSL